MSWSVSYIGTPVKIAEALTAQAESYGEPTKSEFKAALPHMVGLVNQNFESASPNSVLIKLDANGSGIFVEGEQKSGSVTVNLSRIYGNLTI